MLEQNTQPFQLRIQFFRTAMEKALVFEVTHDEVTMMDCDGSNGVGENWLLSGYFEVRVS